MLSTYAHCSYDLVNIELESLKNHFLKFGTYICGMIEYLY